MRMAAASDPLTGRSHCSVCVCVGCVCVCVLVGVRVCGCVCVLVCVCVGALCALTAGCACARGCTVCVCVCARTWLHCVCVCVCVWPVVAVASDPTLAALQGTCPVLTHAVRWHMHDQLRDAMPMPVPRSHTAGNK